MQKLYAQKKIMNSESYDRSMVREALSKALRTKHLQTIIPLSKMIKKNWADVDRKNVDDPEIDYENNDVFKKCKKAMVTLQ